jgi:hypothetical protein
MKLIRWFLLILTAALLAACAPAAATEPVAPAMAADATLPAATAGLATAASVENYPAPPAPPTLSGYPAPVDVLGLPGYPAPGEAGLPESCRPEGMQTFVDPAGRFCFAYPANFSLDASGEGSPMLVGPALSDANIPAARLLMFGTPLAEGQTLQSVADGLAAKYGQANPQLEVQTGEVTLGGEPAVSLEPVPGDAGSRDIVVVHAGEVITLRFEPNVETYPAARMDRDALIDIVLRSFAWLK